MTGRIWILEIVRDNTHFPKSHPKLGGGGGGSRASYNCTLFKISVSYSNFSIPHFLKTETTQIATFLWESRITHKII